jgi:hypothetical protein
VEHPQEVLRECLEKFSTPDYIMEPGIFTQLKRFVHKNHVHAKQYCCGREDQNEPVHILPYLLYSDGYEASRVLVS